MKIETRRVSEPIYEISLHLTSAEMRDLYSGLMHMDPTAGEHWAKYPAFRAYYYALLDAVNRHKHDA